MKKLIVTAGLLVFLFSIKSSLGGPSSLSTTLKLPSTPTSTTNIPSNVSNFVVLRKRYEARANLACAMLELAAKTKASAEVGEIMPEVGDGASGSHPVRVMAYSQPSNDKVLCVAKLQSQYIQTINQEEIPAGSEFNAVVGRSDHPADILETAIPGLDHPFKAHHVFFRYRDDDGNDSLVASSSLTINSVEFTELCRGAFYLNDRFKGLNQKESFQIDVDDANSKTSLIKCEAVAAMSLYLSGSSPN